MCVHIVHWYNQTLVIHYALMITQMVIQGKLSRSLCAAHTECVDFTRCARSPVWIMHKILLLIIFRSLSIAFYYICFSTQKYRAHTESTCLPFICARPSIDFYLPVDVETFLDLAPFPSPPDTFRAPVTLSSPYRSPSIVMRYEFVRIESGNNR